MLLNQNPFDVDFLTILELNLGPSWGYVGSFSVNFRCQNRRPISKTFSKPFWIDFGAVLRVKIGAKSTSNSNFQKIENDRFVYTKHSFSKVQGAPKSIRNGFKSVFEIRYIFELKKYPKTAPTWAQLGLKLGSKAVLKRSRKNDAIGEDQKGES